MGTWSPVTARYLSPETCGLWPNADAKCNLTERRRFSKQLSLKAANVERKLGQSRPFSSSVPAPS